MQDIITQGVHPVSVAQNKGIHHVALGLAHLAAVEHYPPVSEHLFGKRQIQRRKECGPYDGVESHYLLCHHMHVCRPILFEQFLVVARVPKRGDIVEERVQPHVYDVLLIKGHLYAPIKGSARYAQILQARLYEIVQHLLAAGRRRKKIPFRKQFFYHALILAQAEEVTLLARGLHLSAAVGALAVYKLTFRPEGLTGHAVHSLVLALVYVALFIELFEYLLNGFFVIFVRGAYKLIVSDVQALPQSFQIVHKLVHILLGRHTRRLGGALYLLPVLIRARQEKHVLSVQAVEPRKRVADNGGVTRADVPLAAGIVYGSCDIILFSFHIMLP